MRKGGIPNFSVLQVEALKFGFKLRGPRLGSTQAVASSDSLLSFRALVPPSALASRGRSNGGGPAWWAGHDHVFGRLSLSRRRPRTRHRRGALDEQAFHRSGTEPRTAIADSKSLRALIFRALLCSGSPPGFSWFLAGVFLVSSRRGSLQPLPSTCTSRTSTTLSRVYNGSLWPSRS